jgi:hypothetical protein
VVIALIDFTNPNGYQIRQIEEYGQPGSERRPMLYSDGRYKMDVGREYHCK